MGTVRFPEQGEYDVEADAAPEAEGGTCGVLSSIDDERLQLMGLLVRSHRRLTDLLGRELEQSVGIPLVWFDVLIHIGGAEEGRLTMSKLSAEVALTTGRRDPAGGPYGRGRTGRPQELPLGSPQRPRRADARPGSPRWVGPSASTSRGSTAT